MYLSFIVYATYRILEPTLSGVAFADYADFYTADNGNYHYLSPLGTPDLTFLVPGFLHGIPFVGAVLRSPAAVILPFPAGFRFTCYYYRKSYYRAFVARPYACAVPAAKGVDYKGEKGLMAVQNLHRYFLYAAIVITLFLLYDALRSIFTPHGLYFGFGSAFMLVNVAFLMLYTFGCHSFRHLVGGKLDMYSCDPLARWRYGWWSRVTMLNERHALWAWLSLFTVALVDVYINWLTKHPGVTHLFGVIPV
ncbi:MAG TPA: succinate dehydrogenase [Candidatus Thermoplasmatota archaeon]|nr:succinate dehydrogenase [Candidatus Thermoplasmatota archaeon]